MHASNILLDIYDPNPVANHTYLYKHMCDWDLEDPIGVDEFVAYETGHEELCMHRADAVWAAVQWRSHIVPADQ